MANKPKGTVGPVTLSAGGGSGIGGAVSIILFWILEATTAISAPDDVKQATTLLLGVAFAIIAGKIVPPQVTLPTTPEGVDGGVAEPGT